MWRQIQMLLNGRLCDRTKSHKVSSQFVWFHMISCYLVYTVADFYKQKWAVVPKQKSWLPQINWKCVMGGHICLSVDLMLLLLINAPHFHSSLSTSVSLSLSHSVRWQTCLIFSKANSNELTHGRKKEKKETKFFLNALLNRWNRGMLELVFMF